jgi:LPS export ABC transporter protein LptC
MYINFFKFNKFVFLKFAIICLFGFVLPSCSFNYNDQDKEEYKFPELTFEDLEYIRMRGGEMMARLKADEGNRYETRHLMELKNYQFEQFDTVSHEIDSVGSGGMSSVDLNNSNISMKEGVQIRVDSEDFSLRADDLEWKDKNRTLSGGEESKVDITRTDGTEIHGIGFYSDIRDRTWIFNSDANGVYVFEDEEKKSETTDTESETATPETEPEFTDVAASPDVEPAATPEAVP